MMKLSLMDSSSENVIRRNAGREMMQRDDVFDFQPKHTGADFPPLLMNSMNPVAWKKFSSLLDVPH
jgi:hypothetical protein